MLCLGVDDAGEKWGSLIQEPTGLWGLILPSISFLLNRSFIQSHIAEKENYRSGYCFVQLLRSRHLSLEKDELVKEKGQTKQELLKDFTFYEFFLLGILQQTVSRASGFI